MPSNDTQSQARAWVGVLVQAGMLDAPKARELVAAYETQASKGSFGQYLVAAGAITLEAAQRVHASLQQATGAPKPTPGGVKSSLDSGEFDAALRPAAGAEDLQGARTVLEEDRKSPEGAPGSDRWGIGSGRFPASDRPGDGGDWPVATPPTPPVDPRPQPRVVDSQVETRTGSGSDGIVSYPPITETERFGSSGEDSRLGTDSKTEETATVATKTPHALTPGTILGSYTLKELIGQGAMGKVFRACHTESGEVVALKVLSNASAPRTAKIRKRFRREVEALRRLQHPNIVRVHTYERTGTLDWYVMDFVCGRELKEIITEGTLPPLQRLRIFEAVCSGLGHAHERGVIHRDLKPSNVLIGEDGSVWVLDFGLAKLTSGDKDTAQLTGANAALGTPYYMSPEQIQAPKSVTFKADVFGLGVLLYELMAGERPFEAQTSGELARRIIQSDPTPPSQIKPELGVEFDKLCLAALAKDPRRRYRRVEDLRLAVVEYRRAREGFVARTRGWVSEHGRGLSVGLFVATLFYLPIVVVLLVLLLM